MIHSSPSSVMNFELENELFRPPKGSKSFMNSCSYLDHINLEKYQLYILYGYGTDFILET